ncbi:enoyl-CoA hydratase-related protein [Patulibacter brassicae]|uniref:Enoyl-CoA hydratase-related protein n=1 Tax=Patulibacter brassicae TaxID=1705717 RepID=A0ABU4VPH7_9ACTN|nr:enoyl-CoA hydratase-related protein [Patulibacter brassicae]MDX8153345.1 enoyl-CoA hydratase-related protein [Patulibacter brassicae]
MVATDRAPKRVSFALEDDGLGRLRLIAPARRNAIDLRWVHELAAAVVRARAADDLRALLITAEGPAFTVGGDLRFIVEDPAGVAERLDAMIAPFHAALGDLGELDVPIVTAVQGAAAGGGLGLAWLADVVLVAEDLKLTTAFDRLGLSGDGNSSWWLPRLVGLRRAQELLVGGRLLGAEEAVAWGIATRSVPVAELEAAALAEARRLAAGPTRALGRMRRLLREADGRDVRARLVEEAAAMRELARTPDAQEGLRAFGERRAPRFTGAGVPGPGRDGAADPAPSGGAAAAAGGAGDGEDVIVGLVRRLYAALAAGDEAALRELLAPGFEGRLSAGMPDALGGVRRGPDAMIREGWWAIGRRFAVLAEPERWIVGDDGHSLTVLGTYRGRAREDDRAVEAAFAHVFRREGDRLVALEQVTDTARWG